MWKGLDVERQEYRRNWGMGRARCRRGWMWVVLEGRAGLLQTTGQGNNYGLVVAIVFLGPGSNLHGSLRKRLGPRPLALRTV